LIIAAKILSIMKNIVVIFCLSALLLISNGCSALGIKKNDPVHHKKSAKKESSKNTSSQQYNKYELKEEPEKTGTSLQ